MAKRSHIMSRSNFAERLGLFHADLGRRACSKVASAVTVFYGVDGEPVGERTVQYNPLAAFDHEQFVLFVDELADHPAQERICA